MGVRKTQLSYHLYWLPNVY